MLLYFIKHLLFVTIGPWPDNVRHYHTQSLRQTQNILLAPLLDETTEDFKY